VPDLVLAVKCLNTAPWLIPTSSAICAVVIRAGLISPARRNAAAAISTWRSSVGSLVCMVAIPSWLGKYLITC
jgi:hypothetical protein